MKPRKDSHSSNDEKRFQFLELLATLIARYHLNESQRDTRANAKASHDRTK